MAYSQFYQAYNKKKNDGTPSMSPSDILAEVNSKIAANTPKPVAASTPAVTQPQIPQKAGILGFLSNLFPQVSPPASKLTLQHTDNDIKGNTFWEKVRTSEDNAANNLKASPLYNTVANSLPVKAVNRTAYSAANTMTGGGAVGSNPDLGKVGNTAADIIGFGLGMGMRNPGLGGTSINSALNPVGNLAEKGVAKGLNKIGPVLPTAVNKTANFVLPTAARGAAEFGLYGGANNAVQGKNALQGAGEGALNGALFNVGGKALGAGVNSIVKNGLPKTNLQSFKGKTINSEVNTLPTEEVATANEIKPSIGANDRTKISMDIVSGDKGKLPIKERMGNAWNAFYTGAVDRNNPIAKFSNAAKDETYIKATNAANVGTTVNHILDTGLVNRQGKPIDISYKDLVKSLPDDKMDFTNYMLQLHNIDRAREGKPIDPQTTSEQSAKAVQLILQKHPEYKGEGEKVTKWINKFTNEWGHNSGMISDDLWKSLNDTYKNYIPTNRDFTDLEGLSTASNGRGFTDQNIPLKRATGSERDIRDPFETMIDKINSTVRGAKYNEVAQTMLESLRKDPEGLKKYAEILPEGTDINPNVKNVVTVLDKGKKVDVQVNDQGLLKTLQGFQKPQENTIVNVARKITSPYKALITTKNPLFTVFNMARDIPTAYVNGSENNPLMFGKNYLTAYKDLMTNSDMAQQYKALGGGGSNFDFTGDSAKSLQKLTKNPNVFQKLSQGIEKLNNTVESAPRYAEFKASLAKGDTLDKAMYNANDLTTNFSRGGNVTKTVDSIVPYLNAGVQGLDKVARQFKANPLGTTAKGLVSVTVPTLALDAINKDNPNYQHLDNRTKDNYYLFPNPADGGKTFIHVPKSREIGVLFGSLAERAIRAANGEKNAFKGFGNTVATNFGPANPLDNNIASGYFGLKSNKDFAGRTIVPQSIANRSPALQYDDKTSDISKKLGELTNLSPKQIDYIIKSYTGIVGQLALPMTTNTGGGVMNGLSNVLTQKFVSDPLYSNQNVTDFYDNMKAAQAAASDKNFKENIDPKITTHEEYVNNAFTTASKKISDLTKQVTAAQVAGDNATVKALRQQIIDTASEANNLYDKGITPPGEVKAQLDDKIKYNTSSRATSIRNKADQIVKSNQSVADQSQLLQQLLDGAANMRQGKKPKQKAEKPNPYNK